MVNWLIFPVSCSIQRPIQLLGERWTTDGWRVNFLCMHLFLHRDKRRRIRTPNGARDDGTATPTRSRTADLRAEFEHHSAWKSRGTGPDSARRLHLLSRRERRLHRHRRSPRHCRMYHTPSLRKQRVGPHSSCQPGQTQLAGESQTWAQVGHFYQKLIWPKPIRIVHYHFWKEFKSPSHFKEQCFWSCRSN